MNKYPSKNRFEQVKNDSDYQKYLWIVFENYDNEPVVRVRHEQGMLEEDTQITANCLPHRYLCDVNPSTMN